MALELNKLAKSIEQLGENTAHRLKTLEQRLPAAEIVLNAMAADPAKLQRQIEKALKLKWRGAIPTHEPVNAIYPQPQLPTRFNFVAADGSQIYPDRHGLGLYYLINVGSIVIRYGTGEAPVCNSLPQLFFDDQDLYYEGEDFPITSERVNARRDAEEVAELARLTPLEADSAPTVAVIDGTLRLASNAREQNRAFVDDVRKKYLDHLDAVKASRAALAGVIDRSASDWVVRLLNLASLEPDEMTQQAFDETDLFPGATDTDLFHRLKFGERSALFTTTPPPHDLYSERGHHVHFFYLNAGQPPNDSPLRVEVPEWVARDQAKLDLVHASAVEQSQHTGGYPYALTRTHELAVVAVAEHRALDELLVAALVRHGIAPNVSQKARGKAMVAKRR